MLLLKLLGGSCIKSPGQDRLLVLGELLTLDSGLCAWAEPGGSCRRSQSHLCWRGRAEQGGAGWDQAGLPWAWFRPEDSQPWSFSTRSPFRSLPVSILWYKRLFSSNTEMPRGSLRVHGSLPFTVGGDQLGRPPKLLPQAS